MGLELLRGDGSSVLSFQLVTFTSVNSNFENQNWKEGLETGDTG